MVRTFKIRDICNDGKCVGILKYNTDTKEFSLRLLDNYDGLSTDLFMDRCIQLGLKDMPDWMVKRWIRQRLCPPNRHDIKDILKMAGLKEYDEMGLFDYNHGICSKDSYYFDEIGGMLEYRKKHDKHWGDWEEYLKKNTCNVYKK